MNGHERLVMLIAFEISIDKLSPTKVNRYLLDAHVS